MKEATESWMGPFDVWPFGIFLMYEFTPFIPEGTSSKLMGYQLPFGTRSRILGVNLERPSSFSYLRLGDAITRDVANP